MNTTTLLASARIELQMYQDKYKDILSALINSGGRQLSNKSFSGISQEHVDRIIANYLNKVNNVSELTRKANQEYLESIHAEPDRALFAAKTW